MKKKSHFSSGPLLAGVALRPPPPGAGPSFADGLALHQAGRLDEAEKIYKRILAAQPNHIDCLYLLGVIFHQRGDQAQAVRQLTLALKRAPGNFLALNTLGAAQAQLKQFDRALASFDRAIALRPDYAEAHSNRGNVLEALRRFEEAVASHDRALKLRPDSPETLSNRASALYELKRFDEALSNCDRAIALRPDHAEAHTNRGNALHQLRRFEEALASHDRAVKLRPDFAAAYGNRGNALHELNRFDEALASQDRALALNPAFAQAHVNRGNTLQELRRFNDAVASYDRALALQSDLAIAHSNRGNALKELGRFDEALASYRRALTARPDFADAHYNEALCRLLLGDYEAGWKEHEWRWDTEQARGARRGFTQPLWLGTEDVRGRTVLLHAEQGLGDTIQFARYAPLVAERGARVILEVQKPLRDLMRTLPGGIAVVVAGEPLPAFDLHCPLLSLPLAFATRLESIPAQTPYLSASEEKTAAWRKRLGAHDRRRIGLVWAGNPRKQLPNANRIDAQRSLTFDQLAPLLEVEGCVFYSLQKGDDAVEQLRSHPLRERVIDWTDEFGDFADTAALVANLDLVIAVDTSVAHLAGALGKPFWLLNRHNTCWRWLLGRDDSPWYPTARQFRQDAGRDWAPVIARVRDALRDFSGGR